MFNSKKIAALEKRVMELEVLLDERTTYLATRSTPQGYTTKRETVMEIIARNSRITESFITLLGYKYEAEAINPAKWVKIKDNK